MSPIYKFVFPFSGQVKTQLVISKNRLIKPKNVKRFEDAVRVCLAEAIPLEQRPINGYLKFQMIHYTQFKRNKEGEVVQLVNNGDLDNLMKTMGDVFQPVYRKMTKFDKNGEMEFTEKGNPKYTKVEVTPGVIKDDKYIVRAGLYWIPVHTKEEERIEVYITPISEDELFEPPKFDNEKIIDLSI
jgi:Holliday junction resolvase RusA-like endonuclease